MNEVLTLTSLNKPSTWYRLIEFCQRENFIDMLVSDLAQKRQTPIDLTTTPPIDRKSDFDQRFNLLSRLMELNEKRASSIVNWHRFFIHDTEASTVLARSEEVSERSERTLMKTRTMNPARWLQTATSTKLSNIFHSILLTRFTRFALASLKMRLASLGADGGQHDLELERRPR